MTNSPTHHRAVAMVLTVALAIGLARSVHRAADPSSAVDDRSPSGDDAGAGSADPADARLVRIDPNVADLDSLARLPGIGPALARRIAAARDAGPRFVRTDDLQRVRGIGPRTVARLGPFLAFPNATVPDAGPDAGRGDSCDVAVVTRDRLSSEVRRDP